MHKLSKKAIELLWADSDVPINDEEEIDDDFCGWERFTDRNEIWHWFDEQYAKWGGIHALMFPDEHKVSEYGKVMAHVDFQVWQNDYAVFVGEADFDCGRALDMLPFEMAEKLTTGTANYLTDDVYAEAVRMNLVKDHDGPFDCYICNYDELAAYVESRESAAC